MERRHGHTVDVIKTQKGVTVYSVVSLRETNLQRKKSEYKSFIDAQNKITDKLKSQYIFEKISSTMTKLEKGAAAFLILKDVITNISNTSPGLDKDVLPILGIIGLWALTNYLHDINQNNSILTRHRLKSVKEAEKLDISQYKQIFFSL